MKNQTYKHMFNLIKKGHRELTIEQLSIVNEDSPLLLTVAHLMAYGGTKFKAGHPILTLRDIRGETVAHVMAKLGHQFNVGDSILDVCDYNGTTVAEVVAKFGHTVYVSSGMRSHGRVT
jgi:uncharacterized protein YxjI